MIRRGDIDCAILDLDVDRRAPLPIADILAFADVPFGYLTTGVLPAAAPLASSYFPSRRLSSVHEESVRGGPARAPTAQTVVCEHCCPR